MVPEALMDMAMKVRTDLFLCKILKETGPWSLESIPVFCTQFQIKTSQKPYPLAPDIPGLYSLYRGEPLNFLMLNVNVDKNSW